MFKTVPFKLFFITRGRNFFFLVTDHFLFQIPQNLMIKDLCILYPVNFTIPLGSNWFVIEYYTEITPVVSIDSKQPAWI